MTQEQLIEALAALRQGSQWVARGTTLADVEWLDTVQTMPSQAEIDGWIAANPVGQLVVPQDLIAQLTSADVASVQAAIGANPQAALLWYSFLAQRDPMRTTNARFLAGWNALTAIIGQARMTAIAASLGITI